MKRQDKTISLHVDRIEYALIALTNAESETAVTRYANAITESLTIIVKEIKKEMEV